jgi:hypothetical protein
MVLFLYPRRVQIVAAFKHLDHTTRGVALGEAITLLYHINKAALFEQRAANPAI